MISCQMLAVVKSFISISDAVAATDKLKLHKQDGHSSNDHFILAGTGFYVYIVLFFTATLVHGILPDLFLTVPLFLFQRAKILIFLTVPVITEFLLSSVFGQLFDNNVLTYFNDFLTVN
jgi:hypothetical protein